MSEHTIQTGIATILKQFGYHVQMNDTPLILGIVRGGKAKPNPLFYRVWKTIESRGYVKGTPDMLMLKDGFIAFVEVKYGKTGKQSPEQKAVQKIIEDNGFPYFLWRSEQDCIDFMKERGECR